MEIETSEHLFFRCKHAVSTWYYIPFPPATPIEGVFSTLQWSDSIVLAAPNILDAGIQLSKMATLRWAIWLHRNDVTFNESPNHVASVKEKALRWIDEYHNAYISDNSQLSHALQSHQFFSPLVASDFSVFCNVAFQPSSGLAAIDIAILKDRTLVDGCGSRIKASSALMAEAIAIKEACRVVMLRGISKCSIVSDNKPLISLLKDHLSSPWEIESIIQDIRVLVSCIEVSWFYLPRSFNSLAHWVAKNVINGCLLPSWLISPPVEFSLMIRMAFPV